VYCAVLVSPRSRFTKMEKYAQVPATDEGALLQRRSDRIQKYVLRVRIGFRLLDVLVS
jgi:hypothetical protein